MEQIKFFKSLLFIIILLSLFSSFAASNRSAASTAMWVAPHAAATKIPVPPSCVNPPTPGNPFHTGAGTLNSPYLICTANNLLTIDTNNAYLSLYFKLGADIDMQGQPFPGIGTYSTRPFTGNFDGDDHSLLNLSIGTGTQSNIGLFNYLGNGAVVKKLNLVNVSVSGTSNVGALAGRVQSAGAELPVDIDSCTSSGSVIGQLTVGGLVGLMSNTSSNPGFSRLRNSSSSATVMGSLSTAGGLLGNLAGSKSYLENSFANGNLSAPNTVGGLVGTAGTNFTLVDSHFSGTINLVAANAVGGLIGSATAGTVLRSYATGSIHAHDNSGGLIGSAASTLIQESRSNINVQGNFNAGGLIGLSGNNVTVRDSYTRGNVNCISNCGGIAGDVEITLPGTTYQRVYATGQIQPLDILSECQFFTQNPESGALFGEMNPVANSGIVSARWNTETSNQCTAVGNYDIFSDLGVGLTTAQMGSISNFSGWNFSTVWVMPVGGPPKLAWE